MTETPLSPPHSPLPFGPTAPWLAPLAGFSDLPFRLLCRENGARVACTEMVSVKGLSYNSPGTWDLLRTTTKDSPLVVQLFGGEAAFFPEPVQRLWDSGFVYFDLNAGCPVRKVMKTGAGAALMEDHTRLLHIVHAIQEAAPIQMGVKLRLTREKTLAPLLRLRDDLARSGVSWLTLHPRTAQQGYAGNAFWPALTQMAHESPVPILASGDLFDAHAAHRCMEQTGVHGVMFARGALRNPRIFDELRSLAGAPQPGDRRVAESPAAAVAELVRRHGELCRSHDPSRAMLVKMRSFVPRYVKGFPGAKHVRQGIIACEDWSAFDRFVHRLETELMAAAPE